MEVSLKYVQCANMIFLTFQAIDEHMRDLGVSFVLAYGKTRARFKQIHHTDMHALKDLMMKIDNNPPQAIDLSAIPHPWSNSSNQ